MAKAKAPKRKPGEPKRGPLPWAPTDDQVAKVRLYAGLGSTQEDVARLIGISVDTLTRNDETAAAWHAGKAETIAKVAGTLVQKALKGDTTSAIFYLKTQGKWTETVRNEHSGPDGKPIEYQNLSDDEIDARVAALIAGDGPGVTTH